jgi:hypothetical protein
MTKLLLAAIIALMMVPLAHATTLPVHGSGASAVVRVAEGCGNGWWRDPSGACHPFSTPYGTNRGTTIGCPPGWYIGPYNRCYPVR